MYMHTVSLLLTLDTVNSNIIVFVRSVDFKKAKNCFSPMALYIEHEHSVGMRVYPWCWVVQRFRDLACVHVVSHVGAVLWNVLSKHLIDVKIIVFNR